jgi:undecaprenyl-diphosphatase
VTSLVDVDLDLVSDTSLLGKSGHMDFITILILSIVEGVTEFLPISSTGHLILFSAALGIAEDSFVQNFNIVIQFGAISSVLVLYWKRFFPVRLSFYFKIFLSFLPAAIIGVLFKSQLERLLDHILVVAMTLFLGGIVLIGFDKKAEKPRLTIETMPYKLAILIGVIQSLAMIPGVSRSAATIIGGLGIGLSRKEATEYSFFLGVPTLMAAGLYKGYKAWPEFTSAQVTTLTVGTLLSFIFAMVSIKFLLHILSRYGLSHFGWYRIVLGGCLLAAFAAGLIKP